MFWQHRDADPADVADGARRRARDEYHCHAARRPACGSNFRSAFDPVVIREAIQRERFRGGQIFTFAPELPI